MMHVSRVLVVQCKSRVYCEFKSHDALLTEAVNLFSAEAKRDGFNAIQVNNADGVAVAGMTLRLPGAV